MATADALEAGSILDQRYRVDSHHADGGMASVYFGRDVKTGEPVAIKVVRAYSAVDEGRFAREAELLAAIDHPGIVRYIAGGSLDGRRHRYLIEEWIEGVSLHQRLQDPGLSASEVVAVLAPVADALAAAHEAGVIHRDIKPSNLIIEEGDPARTRVVDFGVARLVTPLERLTRTGTVVGTPGYMAPEQARGDRELDARVDVFALGCVLYRCLSGRHPFPGRDAAAVRTKVLWCSPPPLKPSIPTELRDLCDDMLAKNPADRPANASDVAARLRGCDAPNTPRIRSTEALAETTVGDVTVASRGAFIGVTLIRDLSIDELACDGKTSDDRAAKLDASLTPVRGRLTHLDPATAVLRVEGSIDDVAVRLARGGLIASAVLPQAGVAGLIATSETLDAAIEWASASAEELALERLFAGPQPPVVVVDEHTAQTLGSRLDVASQGGRWLVRQPGADG